MTICFMFYTWYEPASYVLAPEENSCRHSDLICAVRLKCVHSMMSHILTIRIKPAAQRRLSSSSADTYVGPACGYKAVLAEALV